MKARGKGTNDIQIPRGRSHRKDQTENSQELCIPQIMRGSLFPHPGAGNYSNLREVGVPSRNILHVRGRGSKYRIRVRQRHRGPDGQGVS